MRRRYLDTGFGLGITTFPLLPLLFVVANLLEEISTCDTPNTQLFQIFKILTTTYQRMLHVTSLLRKWRNHLKNRQSSFKCIARGRKNGMKGIYNSGFKEWIKIFYFFLTLFQRSFIISRSARMCCLSASDVIPAKIIRRPLELTLSRWLWRVGISDSRSWKGKKY